MDFFTIYYMILDKYATVKNNKYYHNLGYDVNEKYIEVKIEDLLKGSNVIISVKCDYCGCDRKISYKNYNKNIKINNKFSCSIKCGCLKSKETNLLKYGVDSTNKLDIVKKKSKKTLINKFGVDHISKCADIRNKKSDKMKLLSDEISDKMKNYWNDANKNDINIKRKNTIITEYGVDNVSKISFVKEKKSETFKYKYGGFTYQSDLLMKKVISTNIIKYGCSYSLSSDFIKNKIKRTNLERYGYECASMNEDIKIKATETIRNKYGYDNIMLSEKFRLKFNITNESNYIKYLGHRYFEFKCDHCNKNYIINYDNYYKRIIYKVKTCTICNPISDQKSLKKKDLLTFISSIYNGKIINGYRDGIEIDIYLPDLKLGFEFNGLYFHSEKFKEKNYHLNKTNYFIDKGIRIIHIWEDDWLFNQEILKSQIRNWINIPCNKIFARNCEIKEIYDVNTYRDFLNKNHIQGYIRSSIKIGLFYNNELVSLMTFDNLEGRKKMESGGMNLSRFCSKLNTNVIGGASKLLKYFINEYKPTRIISFADKDWSLGHIYYMLGFNLSNILKPDYKYIINNKRINKQKFTKSKLKINKTEYEYMKEIGIHRIYNTGQLKFELLLNKII